MSPDEGKPWSAERKAELLKSFFRVIELCNQESVDLLLIAGDLFHKQPLIRDLKEINYYFEKLVKTDVVLIAGNHDYVGLRSNYIDFKWAGNVTMLIEPDLDSIFLEAINTEVYGLSFHSRDIYEEKFHKARAGVSERINILLAHGGDPRSIPIDKKRLSEAGFDYVALGHIHKPEMFGKRMAYAGSLEPLDKNELGDHGCILGEIHKYTEESESEITIEFIPCSVCQYKKEEIIVTPEVTNGKLMELIQERIQKNGTEHIYRFFLKGFRDVDICFDTEAAYVFGNIIEILDETVPDYDFDALMQENRDNIIGRYIEQIKKNTGDTLLIDKALYYGLEALLHASTP